MSKVYWITGLAGSGKTTIGKALYEELVKSNSNLVFLDGDTLREVFGGTFGYSREEREKCAMCYARLCKMLVEQGLTVICCTISMFHSVRAWNRENISNYVEVYVKVSKETLLRRNQKQLYTEAETGMITQVVGMDIEVEEPAHPSVILNNNGEIAINEHIKNILKGE